MVYQLSNNPNPKYCLDSTLYPNTNSKLFISIKLFSIIKYQQSYNLAPQVYPTNPFFFYILRKYQDGDYLEFDEALYFYILSIRPKNNFQLYSCTFSSKFDNFIHIFNKNDKFLAKKEFFFGKKLKFILKWPHGAKIKGCIPHLKPTKSQATIFSSK